VASAASRHAPATFLAFLAALLVAGSAVGQPSSIGDKRAEAQAVLAQIRTIDSEVSQAAEAWNLANIELADIAAEQKANGRLLVIAQKNLGRAQQNLNERIVALYTGSGQSGSALEVLLGATSLDDLINRIDTVQRVSDQDAHVLRQVQTFRTDVRRRRTELARAHREQANVVAQRAAQKSAIEAKLAERQRLLSSIQSEIARLEAAERARQAALEREARARLLAQQQAAAAASATQAPKLTAPAPAPEFADTLVSPGPVEIAAPPPARYGGVVGVAMQFLGTPYRWGGAAPGGFDCSGFVMYVFAQIGVSLPHNAAAQYGYGTPVSRDQLQPGDLVFFDGLGHDGIYIGNGQFIHSPHTGDVVKISSLSDSWYASTWVGARRL
jgi:cell wall-associated NlpC family hydrolase